MPLMVTDKLENNFKRDKMVDKTKELETALKKAVIKQEKHDKNEALELEQNEALAEVEKVDFSSIAEITETTETNNTSNTKKIAFVVLVCSLVLGGAVVLNKYKAKTL